MSLEATIIALKKRLQEIELEDQRIDAEYDRLVQRKKELAEELLTMEEQLAQLQSAAAIVEAHTHGQSFRPVMLGALQIVDALRRVGIASNGQPLNARQVWDACYALGARSNRDRPWQLVPHTLSKQTKYIWRKHAPGLYSYAGPRDIDGELLLAAQQALAQALGDAAEPPPQPHDDANDGVTLQEPLAAKAEASAPVGAQHAAPDEPKRTVAEILTEVGRSSHGSVLSAGAILQRAQALGFHTYSNAPVTIIATMLPKTPGWRKFERGRWEYQDPESASPPPVLGHVEGPIIHRPVAVPNYDPNGMGLPCSCGDPRCIVHRLEPAIGCAHHWDMSPPEHGLEIGVCRNCLGVKIIDRRPEDDPKRNDRRSNIIPGMGFNR